MFFTITNRDGQQTLSLISDVWGERIVPANHPNFETLVTYMMTNPEHDEEYVRGLVDPAVGIGRALSEHFGDRLTFDMRTLYLDGAPLSGPLATMVKMRLQSKDGDYLRFAKFLVNLDENPSKRAKDAVFQWVEKNGLTITEDGRFLGYKAVLDDGFSKSSGPMNFVNGVLYEGGRDTQVPHEIGSVISKKRADVDDTPGGGCSVGLHVGTKSYAQTFAPRLMTVAINPADVVSVPDRDLTNKIRVCKYEVIALADPRQFARGSYDITPQPVAEEPVVSAEHDVEPETKSEERQAIEDDLENLDADQRHEYDEQRRTGASHETALASAQMFVAVTDEEAEARDAEVDDPTDAEESIPSDDEAGYEQQHASSELTLAENAALVPDLKRDLHDGSIGHKPLAKKWSHLTTEASVRRYRKSNGVSLSLGAKVRDAVS